MYDNMTIVLLFFLWCHFFKSLNFNLICCFIFQRKLAYLVEVYQFPHLRVGEFRYLSHHLCLNKKKANDENLLLLMMLIIGSVMEI